MDDLYAVHIAIEEQSTTRIVGNIDRSPLHNLLEYWEEMPALVANSDINLVLQTGCSTRRWPSRAAAPSCRRCSRRSISACTSSASATSSIPRRASDLPPACAILRSLIGRDDRFALVTLGSKDPPATPHRRCSQGCTREEIEEVILTLVVYAGHARATEAMEAAQAVFRERGVL
jgi:hypothetical protein